MKVSLARVRLREPAAQALLDANGARVVLGGLAEPGLPAAPIVPARATLFGPRGACLAGGDGPLIVCDTGHHRLLLWRRTPQGDHAAADLVIGQPHFAAEGRNAKGELDAATLNVPTGVAAGAGILAVADAWNHRVLLWHGMPTRSNQPADVVLGQADFASGQANRALGAPRADTLNWCYGVAIHDARLFVADTGNRRVLAWNAIPERNGAAADLVLGQSDFGALGMRWPHAIAAAHDKLFVADAGANRVMVWSALPRANGEHCDLVLGQTDFSGYHPGAATLNMPYGLALARDRLIVADTANSRLLGFDVRCLATGMAATWLAAQGDFGEKGENRWKAATRASLCWPYAVAAYDKTLVVADSGNNRVLLWDLA
jgi:hypothetical protein